MLDSGAVRGDRLYFMSEGDAKAVTCDSSSCTFGPMLLCLYGGVAGAGNGSNAFGNGNRSRQKGDSECDNHADQRCVGNDAHDLDKWERKLHAAECDAR